MLFWELESPSTRPAVFVGPPKKGFSWLRQRRAHTTFATSSRAFSPRRRTKSILAAAQNEMHRLGERLMRLPHDVIVSLLADACARSDHVRRAAERAAVQHDPIPQWAVVGVLMSPDLLVHVLEPLEVWHRAAGCVCKSWAQVWKKIPLTVRRAIGAKPKGRTWRDEWVDACTERSRLEGLQVLKDPRSYFEAGGIHSIEAMIQLCGAPIQWQSTNGWSREASISCTLICSCLALPLAAAMHERSPRYAASTYALCEALAEQAQRLTAAAPPVYVNLSGEFGLATLDPTWEALLRLTPGISFVTKSRCIAELPTYETFPDKRGFRVGVTEGTCNVYELQDSDVVCLRSAPTDADGYHSLIPFAVFSGRGSHALPPLATVTLESVQQPGEWEVRGLHVQRRLLTVRVTYK